MSAGDSARCGGSPKLSNRTLSSKTRSFIVSSCKRFRWRAARFISRTEVRDKAFTLLQKFIQLRPCRQRGARAESAALHGRDGVAEFHARFEIFAVEKAVKKAGVKGVACAGRVAATARGFESRTFEELPFVINYGSVRADRHAHQSTTITVLQFNESFAVVLHSSDATWKFFRADHDVDQRQQLGQALVDVVDVSRNDRSRLTRDLSNARTRPRIVTIATP